MYIGTHPIQFFLNIYLYVYIDLFIRNAPSGLSTFFLSWCVITVCIKFRVVWLQNKKKTNSLLPDSECFIVFVKLLRTLSCIFLYSEGTHPYCSICICQHYIFFFSSLYIIYYRYMILYILVCIVLCKCEDLYCLYGDTTIIPYQWTKYRYWLSL